MLIINIGFLIANVLTMIIVMEMHRHNTERLQKLNNQAQESLKPQALRDHIHRQEVCVICKGNAHKPAGYPRQVSIHELCLNRYNAGEIEVKPVGQTLHNKTINLRKEMELQLAEQTQKLTGPSKKKKALGVSGAQGFRVY